MTTPSENECRNRQGAPGEVPATLASVNASGVVEPLRLSHADALARVVHPLGTALAGFQVALWFGLRPTEAEVGVDLVPTRLGVGLGVLKLLTLVLLALQLRDAVARIGRREVSPRRARLVWTVGLVFALVALTPLREPLARTFDTNNTHLVSPERGFGYDGFPTGLSAEQVRARHFTEQWRRGEILFYESLLALAIASVFVVIARGVGKEQPLGSVLLATFHSLLLCAVFGYVLELVWWSYDLFYLGSMTGPLALDVVFPWVLYPTTPLAAPFYLAISASTLACVRASARTA